MESQHLGNLTLSEITTLFQQKGESTFRGKQLYHWLYQKRVFNFSEMTNLKESLRESLASEFLLGLPKVKTVHKSWDGTEKFLLELSDSKTIESVLIPAMNDQGRKRNTLCVSSQVGCAIGCTFCNTATQGLDRNLLPHEIVGQVLAVQKHLDDKHEEDTEEKITNIVFMGMGEPFHNFDHVFKAIEILLDPEGLNFSKRKITVSTSGLLPAIKRFATEIPKLSQVNLALSLNGFDDETRGKTMPINSVYPIDEIFKVLKEIPLEPRRKITFEYILMEGINDNPEDVPKLIKLLGNLPCKMNLIPYNEFPGSPYRKPSDERIFAFHEALASRGIQSNIRHSRGKDILAACGMLKTTEKQKN